MLLGQQYAIKAPWAAVISKEFNRTYICGYNSSSLSVEYNYAKLHYSIGPPYIG